ncbi:hypothetical protein KKF55_06645 [Patescibacteria group bacterium]|nr:hypothetical protein [Patescibacteria group bacterium]
MARSEIFQKIDAIETEAEKVVEDAQKQAHLILIQERGAGQKLIEEAAQKASQEAALMAAKAQDSAQKKAKELEETTKKEIAELKIRLQDKIARAKELVK